MRPLRILHVVSNRWWTGSAEPALDLARALRRRDHEVAFACIRGDALEAKARALGLPPVEGPTLEPTARPWALLRDVRALRRAVRDRGVELVHAHLSHDHWLAALALRGTRIRLVRTVHHRRGLHRGPAAAWLFRRTDAVIAVSRGIADAAEAAGIDAARVNAVPGAVDVERFSPTAGGGAIRTELGLDGSSVVGCVARLVPGRGHDVLLEATQRLRDRVPRLCLLLVGRGEGRAAVEGRVRELGLGDVVVFAGYRGDDLPGVLAAMDVAVLLGVGSEESCRAVLEAMAVARPVVAARVGALPETVVDGETGWLVEAAPEAVAERLARVLTDLARARAMGAAGRRRVETLFTPERRAAAVEAVYGRVLGVGG